MYTLSDFARDFAEAKGKPRGVAGAAAGAASKRYKKEIMIGFVTYIQKTEKIDMTPTLARHLIVAFFGRSVDPLSLNEQFAKKGRTAADKSKDLDKKEYLIEKYMDQALSAMKIAENEMLLIRESH